MLAKEYTHKQYVRYVRNHAGEYGGLSSAHRDYEVWRKLSATNLDAAYPQLVGLYGESGRPAHDPVTMLRSCLAMMLCGETSFDAWVSQMRDDPFYALISGFAPSMCLG